jgi:hypothetical protein
MANSPAAGTRPYIVDTALAAIYDARAEAGNQLASAFESVHSRLGERKVYRGRHAEWPTDHATAEMTLRARLAAGEIKSWDVASVERLITIIDAGRVTLAQLDAQARPLNEEYSRAPWSRFFLVTSSAGGHIHRDMNCSTCHPTTRYGWLPELSGLSEADAVHSQGPLLCSVCYPSAPVEWTLGLPKVVDPRVCPGSGQPARYERHTAYCAVCGTWTRATATGLASRHHKPKA